MFHKNGPHVPDARSNMFHTSGHFLHYFCTIFALFLHYFCTIFAGLRAVTCVGVEAAELGVIATGLQAWKQQYFGKQVFMSGEGRTVRLGAGGGGLLSGSSRIVCTYPPQEHTQTPRKVREDIVHAGVLTESCWTSVELAWPYNSLN